VSISEFDETSRVLNKQPMSRDAQLAAQLFILGIFDNDGQADDLWMKGLMK